MLKLLVPTDFSKNANKAVEYSIHLAGNYKAEIILLHAYQLIDTESATRKLLFEEYNYSIAKKLHDELEAKKRKIGKTNPDIKISAELYDNNIKKSIVEASEHSAIDYIVMGTQGASGLGKIFMGSVTASVIGNTTLPVIAIPRQYKWKQPANILLATNGFETAPEDINPVLKIVDLFQARLHIIVFTDVDTADNADYITNETKLKEYQKKWEKRHEDIKVTTAHLKGSEFEDGLQQYITDNSIDMVAMITYKRSFLEKIFKRSSTKKMAYRTQIPLLAIPGTDN